MPNTAPTPHRIGPIALMPGVTPLQVALYLVVAVITTNMLSFVGVIQPYLYSEILHIPIGAQGRLTGLLQMAQYGAVALFILPVGSLADRVGRKPLLVAAMIGYIFTLILLPFASVVVALVALRLLLGAASSGHTASVATMLADFPANASRGTFVGAQLVIQALAAAAITGYLMTRMPGWLLAAGLDKTDALRFSVWGLAAVGAIAVLVCLCFFHPPPHPKPLQHDSGFFAGFIATSKEVLKLSRSDPTFGLVVLIAFVVRSDVFVTSSFLSVWVMAAAKEGGATSAEALRTVGTLQMVLQLSLALSPILFGLLVDRLNRTAVLVGSLIFGAVAFASTSLVHDVHGGWIMVVVVAIGLAETAQLVGSQSLFGERAPEALRGSAMGFFVLMGTISVVVISFISGELFDRIGFTAPFAFLAILNISFALLSAVLIFRTKLKA